MVKDLLKARYEIQYLGLVFALFYRQCMQKVRAIQDQIRQFED